MVGHLML
jgi:AP-3 complex subunit sigma